MAPRMCKSKNRLDGKTVIITGANTGIGKETAKDLVSRGAKVILACRDEEKAKKAAEEIGNMEGNKPEMVVVKKLDLASLASIRKFADEILETENRIDILINNAGVMFCPQWTTEDGFEMQFGVNHLGHFLLTNLLLERIKASAPSRIVVLSSIGHLNGKMHFDDLQLEKNYTPIKGYCQSKLANILFAKELAKRLEGTGVTTYAVHPGAVKTELDRHVHDTFPTIVVRFWETFGDCIQITAKQGAQTSIYCAVSDEAKNESGLYYADCKVKQPSSKARDMEAAKKLWDISCELVGLQATDGLQIKDQ